MTLTEIKQNIGKRVTWTRAGLSQRKNGTGRIIRTTKRIKRQRPVVVVEVDKPEHREHHYIFTTPGTITLCE